MKYTTQMNAARQGIVTKEMEAVAAYEGIDVKGLWQKLQLELLSSLQTRTTSV